MNIAPPVKSLCLLALAMLVTVIVYLPSLNGGFVFDDFANIVSNDLIHIKHASLSELSGAVAGFRSSDVGRPLASLSFALNWLATGADSMSGSRVYPARSRLLRARISVVSG